ncbi:unnamed protein product [Lactuca virosa]|uniref:Uncharacterized protein n=1 Tax=Lactuca virosa TaxID=75947 RepID=A0AAU9PHQ4_9ASTR|nr:unnamed protein product [Lactuca virosa]
MNVAPFLDQFQCFDFGVERNKMDNKVGGLELQTTTNNSDRHCLNSFVIGIVCMFKDGPKVVAMCKGYLFKKV